MNLKRPRLIYEQTHIHIITSILRTRAILIRLIDLSIAFLFAVNCNKHLNILYSIKECFNLVVCLFKLLFTSTNSNKYFCRYSKRLLRNFFVQTLHENLTQIKLNYFNTLCYNCLLILSYLHMSIT